MYKDIIETKDLILGKISLDDLKSIHRNFYSQEETARCMFTTPTKNLQESKERLERYMKYQENNIAYCVYEKKSKEAIGFAGMGKVADGVYEDKGIAIGANYVRKGYGKQILNALIDYLFTQLDAKKIICGCDQNNKASIKLQMSCGLEYSRCEEIYRKHDQTYFTVVFHEITKERYLKLKR